jgi:hypothetical protein
MFAKLRFTLLLPLVALLACGSSPSTQSTSTTSPSTPAYDFNGFWGAHTTETSNFNYPFGGIDASLQVSNGAVTGTLTTTSSYPTVDPYLCPTVWTPTNPGSTLTVTGTLDAVHNLTLTFPIAGGTGTILAALPNDPGTYAFGTWQVAGGTCAMSVTPMVIQGTPTTLYTPPAPASITSSLSGNWSVGADYVPNSSTILPVTGFGGALQFSSGLVTGTILPNANILAGLCNYNLYQANAVAVTGTLDANNHLTLTAPIAGGTATITATLGSNPQTLADGSYQIVGGPCATSATPMTIAQYAPITGTYTGTFNLPGGNTNIPVSGSDATVTVVLTQSTTPNATDGYPITGTFKVTGGCTDSGTLLPSTVAGAGVLGGGAIGPGTAVIWGSITPTASGILDVYLFSNNCSGLQGNLLRQ